MSLQPQTARASLRKKVSSKLNESSLSRTILEDASGKQDPYEAGAKPIIQNFYDPDLEPDAVQPNTSPARETFGPLSASPEMFNILPHDTDDTFELPPNIQG